MTIKYTYIQIEEEVHLFNDTPLRQNMHRELPSSFPDFSAPASCSHAMHCFIQWPKEISRKQEPKAYEKVSDWLVKQ
jgi:hypothetical protein